MDTDVFRKFKPKYGLDSEIVASFCNSFATHIDLPKGKPMQCSRGSKE